MKKVRIVQASRKVGTIIVFGLAMLLVALALSFAFTPVAGGVAALVLTLAMVWFCGRTFGETPKT